MDSLAVDTKSCAGDAIDNYAAVDTKSTVDAKFGNDAAVDTKKRGSAIFDNYAGFVRVRRRQLKGGHPDLRAYRARVGDERATASMSFDLVRAVRVNGKPRHQFLLGLGSQKNDERGHYSSGYFTFWLFAISRMTKHGQSEPQRRRLMAEMVRKGAQLPSPRVCELQAPGWRKHRPSECDELARFMETVR